MVGTVNSSTNLAGEMSSIKVFTETTDGSGQVTVDLGSVPIHENSIVLKCVDNLRKAAFTSLSDKVLTITFYKRGTTYYKTSTIDSGSLPSGVTVESGAVNITSGTPSQTADKTHAYGSGGGVIKGFAVENHTHIIPKIYSHQHTQTATELNSSSNKNLATGESLTFIVLYTVDI